MGNPRQPRPVPTDLTDTLLSLYGMGGEEIEQLEATILDSSKNAYQTQLQEEASKYGSRKPARPPSGSSLSELRNLASRDAESIAKTYNKDLQAEINRLFDANPRGNQSYYAKNLSAWHRERDKFKSKQIALNTAQVAKDLASRDFRDKNRALLGKLHYMYAGAAPVSDECKARFRAGIVDEAYIDSHPTPAHIGCPHNWEQVKVKKLSAQDLADLWVG